MTINCTQHLATPDQQKDGIFDLPEEFRSYIQNLMIFTAIPSRESLENRADLVVCELLAYACQNNKSLNGQAVMIGGAPYFMYFLHKALEQAGAIPVYAFTERKSVEKVVDGKVMKTSIFEYQGLV